MLCVYHLFFLYKCTIVWSDYCYTCAARLNSKIFNRNTLFLPSSITATHTNQYHIANGAKRHEMTFLYQKWASLYRFIPSSITWYRLLIVYGKVKLSLMQNDTVNKNCFFVFLSFHKFCSWFLQIWFFCFTYWFILFFRPHLISFLLSDTYAVLTRVRDTLSGVCVASN